MPLYWLVYRHNNQISVVIEPAHSLIYARLRASIDGLDEGEFTEGHEFDDKWKVAKEMVGRRLSQEIYFVLSPFNLLIWRKMGELDVRYAVVFLVWLSGVTPTDAGTLTSKLRMAQESREQCTNRCDSGYDACIRRCPLSMGRVSCTANCQAQLSACNNRCIGR
jgi:hypothetical protein